MLEIVLCSSCFKDQGLKLDAIKIGIETNKPCLNCGAIDSKKLSNSLVELLTYRFFVRGTLHKAEYGAAPILQFNQHHYKNTCIVVSEHLKDDIKLIENAIRVGLFYYGPRTWMLGENEPLKSLQNILERTNIIKKILTSYPSKTLCEKDIFYRLRKNPEQPTNIYEYDSPPNIFLGAGRLDSKELPIMYCSQELEICVHECRATVEDNLFIASLQPTRNLKLLDLSALIKENTNEFESIDMAIHMLFLAGNHSYEISREIALQTYKAGFDGLIYPSYFSLIHTGAVPLDTIYGISIRRISAFKERIEAKTIANIALFDRPIQKGIARVHCINKLIINKIAYDLQFGPASCE